MDFFTWPVLATAAGAMAATTMIVSVLKYVLDMHGRATKIAALIVAEVITISAGCVSGISRPADIGLLAINGVLVTAAAVGLRELKAGK